MHDEQYTRCPGCKTVFRVMPEQLALRGGQVRCGHCKTVFDGVAQQVSLAPSASSATATGAPREVGTPPAQTADVAAAPAPEGAARASATAATAIAASAVSPSAVAARAIPASASPFDEAALGPPTITLRDARALEPIALPSSQEAPAAAMPDVAYDDRFTPPPGRRSRLLRTLGYATAIVVLLVLIAAQAVHHFRDAIAAHWPATRPALVRLCAVAGCTVRPLRDAAMTHLSIDASDLQADPAHRGLLVLTATLRNRAAWALAYPHLELTLTDAQDQVVVRRVLAPAEYAGGTLDVHNGIAPNGEVAVKMFIDASATVQAGYRLYMFYP